MKKLCLIIMLAPAPFPRDLSDPTGTWKCGDRIITLHANGNYRSKDDSAVCMGKWEMVRKGEIRVTGYLRRYKVRSENSYQEYKLTDWTFRYKGREILHGRITHDNGYEYETTWSRP